jgi:dynein assembly factor 2, axonemal
MNGIDNIAAFTLHVKNVEPSSIFVDQKPDRKSLHVKFSSIGSGFYPVHYAFYLQIPTDNTATVEDVTTEAWDNNMILQLELNLDSGADAFRTYFAGLDCHNLISYNVTEKLGKNHTNLGKEIEDDSLSIEVTEVSKSEFNFEIKNEKVKKLAGKVEESKAAASRRADKPDKKLRSMSESYCDELKIINELECLEIESAKRPKNKSKNRNKDAEKQQKMRSISESSGDEHISTKSTTVSTSLAAKVNSQRKYKSILKRCSYDRSISECSMDLENLSYTASSMDYGIGSYDNNSNVAQSHDSDFGGGESCKKTVRFSDKIKRQLFR